MKIKWIILVFVHMILLQACTKEPQLNMSYSISSLEESIVHEEEYFWLSSSGLPNYAVVETLDNLDINLEEGKALDFNFVSPEKIKGILIEVDSKMDIRVQTGDYQKTFSLIEGVNEFELDLEKINMQVYLTPEKIEKDKAHIEELLFETYERVDEGVYQAYFEKEARIMEFRHAVDWSNKPMENLSYIYDLIKVYPFQNWHFFVRPIDFNKLIEEADKWIGYPVVISGPIEGVEEAAEYKKLYIQNGFLERPLIVYSDKDINDQASINTIGVFLGYEDGLIFFSQLDSND